MSLASKFFHSGGVALKGYDPVAFFTLKQAHLGKATIALNWEGLEWRFVNESHRDQFAAEPEKYLPQYGGFCAFGASEGYKASVKPTAFTIHNGRLYFNFAHYIKKRWLETKERRIEQADLNWEAIQSTEPIRAHPVPIWWKHQIFKLLGRDTLG